MSSFVMSTKTFDGKYQFAVELQRHRQRMREIKGSKTNRYRNIPKPRFSHAKYKTEAEKYRMGQQQKTNIMLFHRLNAIKHSKSHIGEMIAESENKRKQLQRRRNIAKKNSEMARKRKLQRENSITKKHIREMVASNDIRPDKLRDRWRKYCIRKKLFATVNKRANMTPRDVKKTVEKVSKKIIEKRRGPNTMRQVQTSKLLTRGYSSLNQTTDEIIFRSRKKKKKKLSTMNSKSQPKLKVHMPLLDTDKANDIKGLAPDTGTGTKRESHRLTIRTAKTSVLFPSAIIGASNNQLLAHTRYLDAKKEHTKSGLDVYLDTTFTGCKTNRNRKTNKKKRRRRSKSSVPLPKTTNGRCHYLYKQQR